MLLYFRVVTRMRGESAKEFVDAIVISIIVASIFGVFLGETADLIREKLSTLLYKIAFPGHLLIFVVMIAWVAADLFLFILLFYKLYWIDARKNMPTSWRDAIKDMFILAPAATFPWVPIHLFHLFQEPHQWIIHVLYFGLWISLLLVGLVVRHYRFKK